MRPTVVDKVSCSPPCSLIQNENVAVVPKEPIAELNANRPKNDEHAAADRARSGAPARSAALVSGASCSKAGRRRGHAGRPFVGRRLAFVDARPEPPQRADQARMRRRT